MGLVVTPSGESSCLPPPLLAPASSGRGHQHSLRTGSQPRCLAVAPVCTQETPVASPHGTRTTQTVSRHHQMSPPPQPGSRPTSLHGGALDGGPVAGNCLGLTLLREALGDSGADARTLTP